MAAITIVPVDNNNNTDNITIIIDTCYIVVFILGKYITYILEYITYHLPVPVIKDDDDTDDDDDEEKVEEMEEEL